jgi:hypothetical protein
MAVALRDADTAMVGPVIVEQSPGTLGARGVPAVLCEPNHRPAALAGPVDGHYAHERKIEDAMPSIGKVHIVAITEKQYKTSAPTGRNPERYALI